LLKVLNILVTVRDRFVLTMYNKKGCLCFVWTDAKATAR